MALKSEEGRGSRGVPWPSPGRAACRRCRLAGVPAEPGEAASAAGLVASAYPWSSCRHGRLETAPAPPGARSARTRSTRGESSARSRRKRTTRRSPSGAAEPGAALRSCEPSLGGDAVPRFALLLGSGLGQLGRAQRRVPASLPGSLPLRRRSRSGLHRQRIDGRARRTERLHPFLRHQYE